MGSSRSILSGHKKISTTVKPESRKKLMTPHSSGNDSERIEIFGIDKTI